MPQIDLMDDSFIVATRAEIAAAVHDRGFWSQLWPGLELTVLADRGDQGIRWSCAGPLVGSAEVWLEVSGDGVIMHCYLRVEPAPGLSARGIRRETRRRQLQVKRVTFALKDRLEGARPPGSSEHRAKRGAERDEGTAGSSSAAGDLPITKG